MTDLTQLLPTFPIDDRAYQTLELLEAKGVTTLDLLTLAPTDVCARTGLRRDVVEPFIAQVSKALREDMGVGRTEGSSGVSNKPEAQSSTIEPLKVLDGQETIERTKFITTGDPVLDKVLGGGIPTGYITEIVGESGTGKTNFLLPLLLTTQLPPQLGGLSSSALYISTEAPLPTKRLFELHSELSARHPNLISTDRVLSLHCTSLDAQDSALRYKVPHAIKTHNIGLLVLDSVAANFRGQDSLGLPTSSVAARNNDPALLARRGKELVRLGQMLRSYAMRFNIAVVVANQVSDKFGSSSSQPVGVGIGGASEVEMTDVMSLDFQARWFTGWEEEGRGKVPALGMLWTNCLNARIAVYKEVGEVRGEDGEWTDFWRRRVGVVFAPWVEAGRTVGFVIEKGGLRGVEDEVKKDDDDRVE